MFGKPGVPKKAVTPRYHHAKDRRPDLAHLPGERASVCLGWRKLDGEWFRLPVGDGSHEIEEIILSERPAEAAD